MGKNQWIAVSISALLIFALFYWGETTYLKEKKEQDAISKPQQSANSQGDSLVPSAMKQRAMNQLPATKKTVIKDLYQELKKKESDTGHEKTLRNIAHFWQHNNEPVLAGHYFKDLGQRMQKTRYWKRAGELYELGFRGEPDSSRVPLAQKAIHSYKKALSLSPDDRSLKLKLATCYTDGTQQVMKGVQMLLDIVEKDSMHVEANFHLGRLAIRSGQYRKATERLKRVVKQDSTNFRAWLLLGQTQLQRGNKEKAVRIFKRTKSFVKDSAQRNKLNQYIKNITNA